MNLKVDTSSWKPEYLKFEFYQEILEPAYVSIIIKELKSYSQGTITLPKTKHKDVAYLAVNLTWQGGEKDRFCYAGKLAYELLDSIKFEKNGNILFAYIRRENGRFIQMNPFPI
jgi:hypothetical protein